MTIEELEKNEVVYREKLNATVKALENIEKLSKDTKVLEEVAKALKVVFPQR